MTLEQKSGKNSGRVERVVIWRNLAVNGSEYFLLCRTPQGWLLRGTAVVALAVDCPMLAQYEVHCDERWRTRRVEVQRTIGSDVRKRILTVEGEGKWRSTGDRLVGLADCVDVDLAVTPATN